MKLTKKLEAEIRKLYETYWNSYINGDLKTYASLLDKEFRFIGSTEAEALLNKKDSTSLLDAVKDQMAGKAEFRNRLINVEPVDELILVTELSDGYILIEPEWVFYSKFRLSSLLRKKGNNWKFLHQHVSMTDSKAQEGEAYGLEQIRTENIQLRDAVKRRTVELESKNRELEIETALEKVRTVAMSMKESADMLDVCSTISHQLQTLDVREVRNVQTAIFYETRGIYLNYEFFRLSGKETITEVEYNLQDDVKAFVNQMLTDPEAFFTKVFKGAKLKKWIEYQKKANQFVDPHLYEVKSLHYYFYSIGSGALGVSTYAPLNENELAVFKRFRNVFELAYRRFIDIEQAIGQAREAQIEAALERTRTQSMLMQHSSELDKVSNVFHEQLLLLNIPSEFSYVWLPNEEKADHLFWVTWSEDQNGSTVYKSKSIVYPLDKSEPYTAACFAMWESGEPVHVIQIPPEDVKNYFTTWEELLRGAEKLKAELFPGGFYYAEAYMKYGCFGILIRRQLDQEEKQILRRFTIEFERAYTRFLDLQKAEAQARESQIQLALERVRARTMAMQKSDELRDAASLLFKQLEDLGVKSWSSGFNIWQDDGRSATINMCNPDGSIATPYHLPHTEDIFFIKICEARQRHEDLLVMETGGKELEETYNYMFSLPEVKKVLGGMEDTGFQIPKFQVNHCAFFSQGYLMFITYEPVPEMWDVFKRFAKVFEQTYTRFLDLQKAEAQAREAQIEAALERVRSRTMGMQHSEELSETASEMFRQIQALGMQPWACGFNIFDKDEKAVTQWMSLADGGISPPFRTPLTEDPFFISIYDARQRREELLVMESSGKELEETYRYMFSLPDSGKIFGDIENSGFEMPKFQITHCAYFSQGYLVFITYEHVSESWDIFKRFAKVFEQTYTRFLDLQKAEAQAMEAKIEAALEKVRSRTMAMQRSDELADVAQLLFQQVKDLGITAWTAGFNIWQPDNASYIDWVTDPTGVLLEPYTVQLTGHPAFRAIREARLRGDDFFVSSLEGEQIIETYQLLSSFGDKGQFQKILDSGNQFPTRQFNHFVFGSQVSLLFITYEPCPEAHDLFKRFGKVFEQTYTRFLDLQKAEAQAREAKIEAALEKVRSRSLAMHKSDEIEEVLHALYERLKELDIDFYTAIIILFEKGSKDVVWWLESKANHPFLSSLIPYTDISYFKDLFEARQNGTELISNCYPFEEKNKMFHHLFDHTDLKYTPDEQKKFLLETEFATMSVALAKNTAIHLTSYSRKSFSEQDNEVLKRFAKVFEQAYTRFLDLQKAEAQAREAQIEVALERTRTQSMIMQHSKELDDTLRVFHEQVLLLGINSAFSFLWLPDEEKDRHIFWAAWGEERPPEVSARQAGKNGLRVFKSKAINYPLDRNEPATAQCLVDWKSNEPVYSYHVPPAAVENYFAVWQELIDGVEHLKPEYFSGGLHYVEAFMKYGCFGVMVATDLTDDEKKILGRFAIEFERTYTRFLDLQKAEGQAREAQIEAALERVRSRSMGMQKSEELKEVIQVVYEQFVHLNIKIEHTGFVIDYKARDDYNIWIADPLGVPSQVTVPYFDSVYYNRFNEAKKNGEDFFATNLSFEEKNKFYQKLFEYVPGLPEEAKKFYFSCPGLAASTVLLENVCLYIENFSGISYSDEENATLMRFGKVFQQTYTRFLDLQKAEAQAREAKIEAALEKVRSRTMAMQRSAELSEVATVLFQQVKALGVHQWTCGFGIFEIDDKEFTWYQGSEDGDILPPCKIPLTEHPVFIQFNESRKRGDELYVYEKTGELQTDHYRYMCSLPVLGKLMQDRLDAGMQFPTFQIDHVANFSHGNLVFITYEHFPEMHDVFRRFAKVFDQTYTRFLDLQKSEAQAREAKIEAALEKVRSRTMAMQRSAELAEVATVLFQQVKALGVHQWSCGFSIFEIDDKEFTWYQGSDDGDILPPCKIPLTEHPVFIQFNESRKRGDELYVYEKTGEIQTDHYRYMCSLPVLGKLLQDRLDAGMQFPTFQIDHVAHFSHGNLVFITYEHFPEMHDVFKRFAKVFDQTYTRFLDLQKAEAQAREAVKQASVDRVRAEIASMRTTNDLEKITPIIWNELTTLGVPFIRCGVFIMDEEQQQVQSFLSTPDGKAIAAFRQPYNSPGEIAQIVEHWHKKKMYTQHWNEVQFIEFTKNLVQQRAITSGEKYLTENRPTDLYLHFIPFLQGMLYAGSTTALSDDELRLMQDLADAFSTAYARYEDFNKLEAAKQTVEQTLVDLKQTQQQLVQSEKMASLGELTAGIAHEIQNPLNFVNNFSEVNKELLVEMKGEIEKGNIEEVKAIANDIIGNEEKINHHGKRADAIVKGMLQHSRMSSGQKEPTDINALCDEYLRLAYHGLRAKDKSFNAKFETNLDNGIGKINIIPQDIGRVLVNLINNAFYAVNEKQKHASAGSAPNGYEPSVMVTSKKDGDGIELRVTDNGSGIPQKVMDKIFQPFFTTKPTGQGTGLGLSLAYDIIKTHNGEIKVESKEREGTTFIIRLPENS